MACGQGPGVPWAATSMFSAETAAAGTHPLLMHLLQRAGAGVVTAQRAGQYLLHVEVSPAVDDTVDRLERNTQGPLSKDANWAAAYLSPVSHTPGRSGGVGLVFSSVAA